MPQPLGLSPETHMDGSSKAGSNCKDLHSHVCLSVLLVSGAAGWDTRTILGAAWGFLTAWQPGSKTQGPKRARQMHMAFYDLTVKPWKSHSVTSAIVTVLPKFKGREHRPHHSAEECPDYQKTMWNGR